MLSSWQCNTIDHETPSTIQHQQGRSYVEAGSKCPQTLSLPPNMTNSKHRHKGAKRSVLWPSKYAKMCFWLGLRFRPHLGAQDAPPGLPSRLGRGHPSHTHTTQRSILVGAMPPNIWGPTTFGGFIYTHPHTPHHPAPQFSRLHRSPVGLRFGALPPNIFLSRTAPKHH